MTYIKLNTQKLWREDQISSLTVPPSSSRGASAQPKRLRLWRTETGSHLSDSTNLMLDDGRDWPAQEGSAYDSRARSDRCGKATKLGATVQNVDRCHGCDT
jgi:hypothetical protein